MPRLLLAFAILGFALTMPAFAGSGVEIIYPPPLEATEAAAPLPAPAPPKVIKQNVVTIVVVTPRRSNRDIVKRALFQNYTGFIHEYSGPRYPF